jgi:hypothetical protein
VVVAGVVVAGVVVVVVVVVPDVNPTGQIPYVFWYHQVVDLFVCIDLLLTARLGT